MTPLQLYRDDGPVARAIGALVRISSSLVTVIAVVPLFVVMALKGDGASHARPEALVCALAIGRLAVQVLRRRRVGSRSPR